LGGNISTNGQTVGPTEISHLAGLTSNVQTQLNSKAPINNPTFTGVINGPQIKTYNIDCYNESTTITYTSNLANGQSILPAVVASISSNATLACTINVLFKTSAKYTVTCQHFKVKDLLEQVHGLEILTKLYN
jgi:hypothetical protein